MCNSPEVELEGQLCHLPLGLVTAAIPPCPPGDGQREDRACLILTRARPEGCTHCSPSHPIGQNLVARMHQAAKKTEVNWIICLQLFLFSLPLARFTRMEGTSLSHWFGASTRGICGGNNSMLAPSQGHVFLLTLPTQLPPYTEKSPPKEPLFQRIGDSGAALTQRTAWSRAALACLKGR